MSIFTEAELEAYAGVAVNITDYMSGHDYAKELIEDYTGATLETTVVTGEVHGFDQWYIPLKVLPVQSVARVLDEDDNIVDPDDYRISDNALGLEFDFYRWLYLQDYRNYRSARVRGFIYDESFVPYRVKVDYTGGHGSVPQQLKRAALEICKQRILPTDTPARSVRSLTSEGVTFQFILADWQAGKPTGTDWVDAALNAYRIRRF